jgi:hypothetical protein
MSFWPMSCANVGPGVVVGVGAGVAVGVWVGSWVGGVVGGFEAESAGSNEAPATSLPKGLGRLLPAAADWPAGVEVGATVCEEQAASRTAARRARTRFMSA